MVRSVGGFGRLVAAVLCLGCGSGRSFDRYVPPPATAEEAVASALAAWQAGQPLGPVEGGPRPIQVVDSLRRPGQRLTRYEVLGEVPADAARCVAVRLVLEDPVEEQTARYVVVGVDPLWVFRLEDYEMMAHWECGKLDGRSAETQ